MTRDEVAEFLSVSGRTIDRFERDEGLPVHRMGKGSKAPKRYFRAEVLEWLRLRWSCGTPGSGGAS